MKIIGFITDMAAVATSSRRVNGFEEGKAVEIRVPGVDAADAVPAHKDRRLGVVEEVAAQESRPADDFGWPYVKNSVPGDPRGRQTLIFFRVLRESNR